MTPPMVLFFRLFSNIFERGRFLFGKDGAKGN